MTRASTSVSWTGIAKDDEQAQREVGDVGEGPADAEHERRQRREDAAAEEVVDLLELLGGGVVVGDDPDPVLGEGREELALEAALEPLALGDRALTDGASDLGRSIPSAPLAGSEATTLSWTPATRTMKNSSRLLS